MTNEKLTLTSEDMRKLRIYGKTKTYKKNNKDMEKIKVELSDLVKEKFNKLEPAFFRS